MISMISRLQKSQAEAEPELDASLALLVKIDEAGMLDSFVLSPRQMPAVLRMIPLFGPPVGTGLDRPMG